VKIVRLLSSARVIARGRGIRELRRLRRCYPAGRNWRKKAAEAEIVLNSGITMRAEVHWYEAHGYGRVEFKIKRLL
jgi:hypothetical protein